MVILNLELDNIFSFNDFNINFTYKKKIVNNQLGDEHLKGYPFFRYRKVNVITGTNATGKTTLGKSIMMILNFINDKNFNYILNSICKKDNDASFIIDYYCEKGVVNRIECVVNPNAKTLEDISLKIYRVAIDNNDSYESYLNKLSIAVPSTNINDINNNNCYWTFKFPFDTDKVSYDFPDNLYYKYEKILNKIIKTLDPLVDHVAQSTELNKCFNIFFKNGMQTLPVEDGRSTLDMPRLSSGTKYAFNLAYVYLAVKEKLNGFFYVDEQFSYINNDIEKAFISLLFAMIEEDDQIIFTTHNTDILDLNLPNHAYGFLKKVDLKISYQNAAEVEKKNNVSIKNDYDNDRFNAAPDLTLLYELGD